MIDFSPPEVKEAIGKLIFTWPKMDLEIIADRITDNGSAELWFYHVNSTGNSLLHTTKANLLSTPTMGQIAKRMQTHSEDVPWTPVLTYISAKTMEYSRRGEPGVVIEPSESGAAHPGYFIEPVIMKGVNNTIYGDKGVNKTTLALCMLGIIALGCNEDDNQCGLAASDSAGVAMLDWEVNQNMTNYTLSRLITGGTIPWYPLPYLRCRQPLVDDIDRISNFLHDNQAQVVLIDSLGQAAGSDKFDSSGKGAALRFFEALRQLNITPIIIGQNAKNEEGKKTIFGSAYFTYYSRNIFELKGKPDEINVDEMHAALFHEWSNYSKKYPPLGFNLSYTDSTIKIVPENVSLSQFLERANLTRTLLEFLRDGPKSVKAISDELELSDKRTRTLLSQQKKKKRVIDLGSGMWGEVTKLEP